MKEMTSIKRD